VKTTLRSFTNMFSRSKSNTANDSFNASQNQTLENRSWQCKGLTKRSSGWRGDAFSFLFLSSAPPPLIFGGAMGMGLDVDKIENVYDRVAKEYAEAFSGEHEKKPKDQEILRRFSLETANRRPVWDLGCGPGHTTQYLKGLGVEISGLDLSEKILAQARSIHPEIYFRKGNILELEFEKDSIAGVVAFYAIVHFTEEQVGMAFREVFRVLQPGGIFLFTYHIGEKTIRVEDFLGKRVNIDFMFFRTDFIVGCLNDCGFENIETIEREPYPGVEYESRRAYVFARTRVADKPWAEERFCMFPIFSAKLSITSGAFP
jgi:ubiquinone/menaquinone biosynthesis C-methylase UbiE